MNTSSWPIRSGPAVIAWRAAAQRRNEAKRALLHHRQTGTPVDVVGALAVGAEANARAPRGRYPGKGGRYTRWPGNNHVELARWAEEAGLGRFGADDPDICIAVREAGSGRSIGPEEAGRLLGLTAEIRDLRGIRTMESIDETKAEREDRRALERAAKDAVRKEAVRRAEGAIPRAKSKAALKPWAVQGKSKATYYRHLRETNSSAKPIAAETDPSGETNSSAPPRALNNIGCADETVSRQKEAAPTSHEQRAVVETGPSQTTRSLGDGKRAPKTVRSKKRTGDLGRPLPEEPSPLMERSAEPAQADDIRAGSTASLTPSTAVFPEPDRVEDLHARAGEVAASATGLPDLFGSLPLPVPCARPQRSRTSAGKSAGAGVQHSLFGEESSRDHMFRGVNFFCGVELGAMFQVLGEGDAVRGRELAMLLPLARLRVLAEALGEGGVDRCGHLIMLARRAAHTAEAKAMGAAR
ncbi:hypothetical protein [Bosea sp. 685]|uniref:hypothetical protein n=1 Tax=Bosea sp. 685 TaxID=3080057 RepID=UPI002892FA41|nr:hypothetical protein [Bosea sp. 685]WNJ93022.1 hypothetical protein RMR04_12330 [Bosea sp. 685]